MFSAQAAAMPPAATTTATSTPIGIATLGQIAVVRSGGGAYEYEWPSACDCRERMFPAGTFVQARNRACLSAISARAGAGH